VNRSEDSDKKPFGSSWWHNGARSTWYIKADDSGTGKLAVGLFHRKCNVGCLRPAVSLTLHFGSNSTIIEKTNMSDNPELSEKMPLWQRIQSLYETDPAPKTRVDIAEALNAKIDSVKKAVLRKDLFRIVQGKGNEQDKVVLA
jgi:hypothetical protein